MIGTEMSRCAPTMNGGVEHAVEVGAIDRTAVHADSDETTRELVHDHEHPVAPEHDGLASKEVHAPQAVCRVSDEGQVKQSEQEVLHARGSVGQASGATQPCPNHGFSERIGNSRRTGYAVSHTHLVP